MMVFQSSSATSPPVSSNNNNNNNNNNSNWTNAGGNSSDEWLSSNNNNNNNNNNNSGGGGGHVLAPSGGGSPLLLSSAGWSSSAVGGHDTVKEGVLNCKVLSREGKRASDRSWRPAWAVLKSNGALYLCKEKKDNVMVPMWLDAPPPPPPPPPNQQQQQSPSSVSSSSPTSPPSVSSSSSGYPIALRASGTQVDVAYDYTKRKNVFKISTPPGSEYLFQTSDHDSMLEWIREMQMRCGGSGGGGGDVGEVASSASSIANLNVHSRSNWVIHICLCFFFKLYRFCHI